MPTTDTPPAAPTADDYRAALALIDSTVMESSVDVAGFPVMLADTRILTAVIAIARDEIAQRILLSDLTADGSLIALIESQDAHIAALVALATVTP